MLLLLLLDLGSSLEYLEHAVEEVDLDKGSVESTELMNFGI